jgi:hypothetical protein
MNIQGSRYHCMGQSEDFVLAVIAAQQLQPNRTGEDSYRRSHSLTYRVFSSAKVPVILCLHFVPLNLVYLHIIYMYISAAFIHYLES